MPAIVLAGVLTWLWSRRVRFAGADLHWSSEHHQVLIDIDCRKDSTDRLRWGTALGLGNV